MHVNAHTPHITASDSYKQDYKIFNWIQIFKLMSYIFFDHFFNEMMINNNLKKNFFIRKMLRLLRK
jgi:hypothetical protein